MKLPVALAGSTFLARPIAVAKGAIAALEAMRQRDRLALCAALLSLIIGLDFLLVLPMRDKRFAIENAQQASVNDEAAARSSQQAEQDAHAAELKARQVKVTQGLAAFGAAGKQADSLRFLLSRTLQGLPVTVQALRAMSVEETEVTAAAAAGIPADASASAPMAEPAALALEGTASDAPAAAAQTLLYRHRYELRLSGALPALLSALEALEGNARPLRIERVRLQADADGALEASVVLMTLGSERTWLSL
ncbi:MAG: hypothetical protein AD742_06380 [Methylibium sp. NZG]|nr:MAG: hypothetical protein AD742_06380 [Methylibium sp. NZG]